MNKFFRSFFVTIGMFICVIAIAAGAVGICTLIITHPAIGITALLGVVFGFAWVNNYKEMK